MDLLPVRRALLSVTDKSGLVEFATFLSGNGVELVSTGGTARRLEEAGLAVTPVSRVTCFPEILGGRVKTLHPAIHGGILADKDNPSHMQTLIKHGVAAFDLVCVNLYAFATAVAKGLALPVAVEEIDIGGPCLLRAAAKNVSSVLVVPSSSYYPRIMEALTNNSVCAPFALRLELAAAAFAVTSSYDDMIASYLNSHGQQRIRP